MLYGVGIGDNTNGVAHCELIISVIPRIKSSIVKEDVAIRVMLSDDVLPNTWRSFYLTLVITDLSVVLRHFELWVTQCA